MRHWQQQWQQQSKLDIEKSPTYATELVLITVARILIAQNEQADQSTIATAISLLARLHQNAKAADRIGRLIQIHVLQALAYDIIEDEAQALAMLGEALILAEPAGYIPTFVDEGAPMAYFGVGHPAVQARQCLAPRYVDQGAVPHP